MSDSDLDAACSEILPELATLDDPLGKKNKVLQIVALGNCLTKTHYEISLVSRTVAVPRS